MNLADVFTVLFVVLGFVVVFISYWLLAVGLSPEFVARAAERLQRGPLRMFFLGAVTFVPLLAAGIAGSSKAGNGAVKLVSITLVLVVALLALLGSAAWALRVGQGLPADLDQHQPWRRVLRGGTVLGLAFVLPFVGTFLVMPYVFISGFGTFVAGCLTRWRAIAPAVSAPSLPILPQVS